MSARRQPSSQARGHLLLPDLPAVRTDRLGLQQCCFAILLPTSHMCIWCCFPPFLCRPSSATAAQGQARQKLATTSADLGLWHKLLIPSSTKDKNRSSGSVLTVAASGRVLACSALPPPPSPAPASSACIQPAHVHALPGESHSWRPVAGWCVGVGVAGRWPWESQQMACHTLAYCIPA